MEWLIMMGGGLSATATNLGYLEDSRYVITEECHDMLEQILTSILQESKVKRGARRNIANSRLIQVDLIPILCHSTDDPEVFQSVIRLLMHLTMPLEVIMPVVKQMTKETWQQRYELQKMLATIKNEFTQPHVTAALVSQMALIIEEAGNYPIDKTNAETISDCLTLIRNVLYINYERYKVGSLKNDTIIGYLLKNEFDEVLKDLCRRSEGKRWLSSLLQVLHLLYKDTSAAKMISHLKKTRQKELSTPKPPSSTLDITRLSVPSDSQSTTSSAYMADTEVENDGSETSQAPSNTENLENSDDIPSSSSSTDIQPGGGDNHSSNSSGGPSDDSDDSNDSTIRGGSPNPSSSSGSSSGSSETDSEKENIKSLRERNMRKLADFAMNYVKHGMDIILMQCKDDLKSMVSNHYFLWQLIFFLPFSALPDISYTDIKLTLAAPVLSQMLFTAMTTWEDFVKASSQRDDSKANSVFKILHMQLSCLRQMFHAIELFTTNPQSTDLVHMKTVLATIALTKGVRNFYHLLIRKFQPQQQTLEFLRDIIVGNDILLRIINQVQHIERPDWGKLDMATHVNNFATRPTMCIYNYLLSKFSQNVREENEAVMTMMYHISVDLQKTEVLFQIPILSTFASLWESGSGHITKQSVELIDYIVREFAVLGITDKERCLEVVTMIDSCTTRKRKHKIGHNSDSLAKNKKMQEVDLSGNAEGLYVLPDDSGEESDQTDTESESDTKWLKPVQTIEDCLLALKRKGFQEEVVELQEVLLEICYFKSSCPKVHIGEPHIWHRCLDGKSVPIMAFTEKAERVQADAHFKDLLQKLGIHTSQDTGHLNPSVPAFWTSDMCFKTAKKLGDINQGKLKFEIGHVHEQPIEAQVAGQTQERIMLSLEDLDLSTEFLEEMSSKSRNTPYFEVPSGMWCNVIKRANMYQAK